MVHLHILCTQGATHMAAAQRSQTKLNFSHRKPHTQSKDWPMLSRGTDIKLIDYNSYLMVLSLISRLFIGLSTRVDGPWILAVEMPGKPVLSFSSISPELLSKGVQLMAIHASKTSDKKTAEWCRLSWCLCWVCSLVQMNIELKAHPKLACLLSSTIYNQLASLSSPRLVVQKA